MPCALMCSYKTLPMIGIDCGKSTDHFMRASLIGNGASPKCGMPASLATVDTAIVGGVVHEPMMMSALDSVTKRRALVVAAVGSPPSSSTINFSGTPPISFGTKSSALRSGMPSAAAGPVVVTVMPITISLDCASAGEPGKASAATTAAADRKTFFIHSSLDFLFMVLSKISRSIQPLLYVMPGCVSAPREPLDDLL